jgi:hypothetical protein
VWARQAAALLLSVAKLTFDANGKPNRHAFHDVGLATANLSLQATALGLALHQMGGFDAMKAREEFSIPEDMSQWRPLPSAIRATRRICPQDCGRERTRRARGVNWKSLFSPDVGGTLRRC